MILFLVMVVVMALPAVWLFARTKPATSRVDLLRRFNTFTWFFVMLTGASAWIYLTQGSAQATTTPSVSPYLAIIGTVASGSGVLLLAAMLRILVFRRFR